MNPTTREQYEDLESALISAALGSGLETVSELQTENHIDGNGHRRSAQRVRKSKDVNVDLALKLLSERIGGPQDYC